MMIRRQLSIITIVLFCFATLLFPNVRCTPDINYVESGGSTEKYEEGSDYGNEIDEGLEALTYGVAGNENLQMTITGRLATGFAYCQGYLQDRREDCTECLKFANEFLRDDPGCAYSVAAYVALVDCGMRYGMIPQE